MRIPKNLDRKQFAKFLTDLGKLKNSECTNEHVLSITPNKETILDIASQLVASQNKGKVVCNNKVTSTKLIRNEGPF